MTRLLSESQLELKEAIKSYLRITPPADWNTVALLEDLLTRYAIADIDGDLSTFKSCYIEALQSYRQCNIHEKVIAATERLEALPHILKAPAIRKIFHQRTEVQASKTFKEMDAREKAAYLVDKLGDEGVLDMSVSRIPYRFRGGVKDISAYFSIPLKPMVTLDEWRALLDFAKCKSGDDVDDLLAEMFAKRNITGNLAYIRSAIDGLQALWKSNRLRSSNDEGWFRQNVYSYIWDRLFLHNDIFYTKRAECLSAVIKELQESEEVAQQRLDFILLRGKTRPWRHQARHQQSQKTASSYATAMEEQTGINNAGKRIGSYYLPMEGNATDNLWYKNRG